MSGLPVNWNERADDRLYETVFLAVRPITWADIRQHNYWIFPLHNCFGVHIPLYSSGMEARESLLRREGIEDIVVYGVEPHSADGVEPHSAVGADPLMESVLVEVFLPMHVVLDLARARDLDRHPTRSCWRLWDPQGLQLSDYDFRERTVYNIGNTLI